MVFKNGDTVRIRKEWRDRPNDDHIYEVVNVNEATNRCLILLLDSELPFPPVELVSAEVIEKA